MRVLVVARCKNGKYAPFITEQVDAVQKQGVDFRFFGVDGKGILGYLRQIPKLKKAIRAFHPDLIHAHYGLCGLLANYQRRIPVVTTYHGSDINDSSVRLLSQISILSSRYNIFVSRKNIEMARPKKNYSLIPCGINLNDYPMMDRIAAREKMELDLSGKNVLFAGAFSNSVKNVDLAEAAMTLVPEAKLLELKGYTRPQVAVLLQAVDVLLMTSHTEGSPQVIKEAMVCGCPIVSVDVGDVKERISGIDGCFVVPSNAQAIAEALRKALSFEGKTKGRERVEQTGLTSTQIAARIKQVYHSILSDNT